MVQVAQALVISALVYATWRFGAVEVETQHHLSILAGFTVALLFFAKSPLQALFTPAATRVFIIVLVMLLWGILQVTPLPRGLVAAISAGATITRDKYSDVSADQFITLSTVPSLTLQALALQTLILVYLVLSCVLFTTRRSRLFLLVAVSTNAAALTFWGLVQRISGSRKLLPGSDHWEGANSFATFVNQNGGGLAVAFGLSCAIGLFFWSLAQRGWLRQDGKIVDQKSQVHALREPPASDERSEETVPFSMDKSIFFESRYSGVANLLEPSVVASFLLIVFLAVGVIASLSRGVWLSTGLSALAIGYFIVTTARWQAVVATLVAMSLCVIGFVAAYDALRAQVISKSERLSETALFEDARWEHWRDSWRLGESYFPVGSGLGTYSFAQLEHQPHEQSGWLKQAHNQYLECFAECGIPGIVLLLLAAGFLLKASWQSFIPGGASDAFAISSAGGMTLILVLLHSLVDFVVAMPGNLLTLALISGAVLSAASQKTMADFRFKPSRRVGLWCLLLFCGCIVSERMMHRSVLVNKVLASTKIPKVEPSLETCVSTIGELKVVLAQTGNQFAVLQRIAAWESLKFRALLGQSRPDRPQGIRDSDWAALLIDGIRRSSTADEIVPDNLQAHAEVLQSALKHLRQANQDNPFVAQSHLLSAQILGVLAQPQWQKSAERSRRISKLNPELFFLNGLLGYASHDRAILISEFQRCLQFTSQYDVQITHVALEMMPAVDFVTVLLPDDPQVLIRFLGHAGPSIDLADQNKVLLRRAKGLLRNPQTSGEFRMLAAIATLEGDSKQTIEFLQAAIHADPRDSRLRLELATSLFQKERLDEAYEQSTLASSLGANQASVLALQKQIMQRVRERHP